MSFDYPYTCYSINCEISKARKSIEEFIDGIVEELCPPFHASGDRHIYIETWANNLYNELEPIFETTRETNENMRKAANSQIEDLESEQDKALDLRDEIKYLEQRIRELERENESFRSQLGSLDVVV